MIPDSARLIVLERTGRWAAALRQAAGRRELPLVETRSFEQATRELAQQPAAMAAIEVPAASLLKTLAQAAKWRTAFPTARLMLLTDPELAPLEPYLRESGAVHVVFSPQDLKPALRIIWRHLSSTPAPKMSLEESIWARLPWPKPIGG